MKSHDYDPAWDYTVDETPYKNFVALTNSITDRIKKVLMPLKEFPDFSIAYITDGKAMGIYVDGTYSEPVILLDIKEINNACAEYDTDMATAIETTITHELAHAIQDARHIKYDEEEAESFANQYHIFKDKSKLTLIKKKKLKIDA